MTTDREALAELLAAVDESLRRVGTPTDRLRDAAGRARGHLLDEPEAPCAVEVKRTGLAAYAAGQARQAIP